MSGCARETPYAWHLPPGFPLPRVPEDNALTLEKIELGRHLFYDKRLSANGTQACASCHQQSHAFAEDAALRSEEHTSELQSLRHLVCRLLLEQKTE